MILLIASLFTAGITIGGLQQASAGDPPPTQPFETEKFYTETDKDFENNFFGTLLPIKDDGKQTVSAVIHPKKGTISSYNPGQYYAVTKVTANEPLDSLWIFEDDRDCTGEPGISKMNPKTVPGGAYVALMCGEQTIDLSDELAESGALRINDDGFVEAHVEDVPAGCMVFLGVKYSPGLKGEDVESIQQRSCENWEFVKGTTVAGQEFEDSAHRVLGVTGLPVECTDDTDCGFFEQCIPEVCDLDTFTCIPGDPVPECCSSDAQCDDGDACTLDFCDVAGTERCFTEPNPDPVCLPEPVLCTECLELATSAQTLCESRGGSDEECLAEAEQILSECALTCEGTPEEKTGTCGFAAVIKDLVCQNAGGDFGVCLDEKREFFTVCSGEEFPNPCTECLELATSAQTLCEDRGGSDEECIAEAEQILSECALTCEGTPEEKADTCGFAAVIKDLVCQNAGGEALACQEEADDFFEACFGAPLPVCGNDLLEVGEECDDGNTDDGDSCSAACVVEFCGDGTVNDSGAEECDGSDLGGTTCDELGLPDGDLACGGSCMFDTSGCFED
jgi:cysteine-rich repeat protein